MIKTVGIGEYLVSNDSAEELKTYALASCVAVTVYSPSKKAAGMIHIALPFCISEEGRWLQPGYYAETGVPLLIEKMSSQFGCTPRELHIQLFGGADSIKQNDLFKIGSRNVSAVKSILENRGLSYYLTEVGGYLSRTIVMKVATGNIKVYTQPLRI